MSAIEAVLVGGPEDGKYLALQDEPSCVRLMAPAHPLAYLPDPHEPDPENYILDIEVLVYELRGIDDNGMRRYCYRGAR